MLDFMPSGRYLEGKQNCFLAESPKPNQGPWKKPKFRPKPKQPLSAKIPGQHFGQICAAKIVYFGCKRLFWQKKVFWPKADKKESRNTETVTCTECWSQGRAKLHVFPRHLALENTQLSPSLTPNTRYFGRNFRPKPNLNCFGLRYAQVTLNFFTPDGAPEVTYHVRIPKRSLRRSSWRAGRT